MTTSVTQTYPSIPQVVCDFGWFYGSTTLPKRVPESHYSVGSSNYPPAYTTLTTGVTLPTLSPITVASTANFESTGTLEFYSGIAPNQRTVSHYTVLNATHFACSEGSGTFPAGTAIFDPRFYADALPLQTPAFFDAIDSENMGLPKVITPSGVSIVEYRWDLGNGTVGLGPVTSTTYAYSVPPESITVSLSVTDNYNRTFSCAHFVPLLPLIHLFGGVINQRQSNLGYR